MRVYFSDRLQTLLAFGAGEGEVVFDTTNGEIKNVRDMCWLFTIGGYEGYVVVDGPGDESALMAKLAHLEATVSDTRPAESDEPVVLVRLTVAQFFERKYDGDDLFAAPLDEEECYVM